MQRLKTSLNNSKIVECSKERLKTEQLIVQHRKLEKQKPSKNKRRFYRAEMNKTGNKDSVEIKATIWYFLKVNKLEARVIKNNNRER